MDKYLQKSSNNIISLHRYSKRTIAIITDMALCILCTWLAFVLRLEEIVRLNDFILYSALISIVIAIPIFWFFGLYRTIFRYATISLVSTILASLIIYGLIYFLVIGIYSIHGVPRTIGILQPMILFFTIIGSRLGVKYIFTINIKKNSKKKILIYGAGDAGRQLLIALENSLEFKVIGFLDDDEQLHSRV